MKRSAQYLCLILICTPGLPACAKPLTYSAEPIEAWVIDAETKKPMEGVIVTANWQLVEGTLGGSRPLGQLKVMEAVTDKNGRFAFPAWGPIEVTTGHLVSEDPQLLIFKSGYQYLRLYNQYTSDRELRLRPVRRSDWNGKTIEVKQLVGNGKNTYLDWSFQIDLRFLTETDAWKQTPCALLALDAEAKRVGLKGILSFVSVSNPDQRDGINEFFARAGQCKKP